MNKELCIKVGKWNNSVIQLHQQLRTLHGIRTFITMLTTTHVLSQHSGSVLSAILKEHGTIFFIPRCLY
jgi:hypothetical protein